MKQLLSLLPLDDDVTSWLGQRHELRVAPALVRDHAAFLDAIGTVEGLIVPHGIRIDARVLMHAPWLRAVACAGDAADWVDLAACERAGVAVLRAGHASAQAEAEFALGALLALLRRAPAADAEGRPTGRELGPLTIGLVGMPPAARQLARLVEGFGARVVGYEPSLHASAGAWPRWGVQPLPLRELLAQSDALCVQLGSFSRYRGLFGDRLLPLCKPQQLVVCLTDAEVFDVALLADALRTGRLAGAWLDHVDPAALEPGRPLAGLPTLQATPRLAACTREAQQRSAWSLVRQIDASLAAASHTLAARLAPADQAVGLPA